MRKLKIYTLAALSLCSVNFSSPASAEPVRLSIGQAEELLNGLAVLSAGQEVIVKESGGERAVRQAYRGWSLATIMAITQDINALKPTVIVWQEAQDKRKRELAGDDGKLSMAAQRSLVQEFEAQRAAEQTYELTKLRPADLKLDANSISPTVVSAISLILVEDSARQ